jgi:beta-glucosidase
VPEQKRDPASFKADYEKHHALARKAAASGAVLLKNRNQILPLSPEADFAVIGGLAKAPRYQGSGSSRVNPRNLVSFCDYLDIAKYGLRICAGLYHERRRLLGK